MDEGLAATISPTEQYSDLSDKELDCPFNVRCQMHGQARGAGREYDLSNHGSSLKSATWAVRLSNQMRASSFGDTRLWWGTIGRCHVILCHQGRTEAVIESPASQLALSRM